MNVFFSASPLASLCNEARQSQAEDKLCLFLPVQFFFPYTLIKFDIETEEPVRNSEGLCIEVAPGEPVLRVEAALSATMLFSRSPC